MADPSMRVRDTSDVEHGGEAAVASPIVAPRIANTSHREVQHSG
jgi:hypothetical protein